MLLAACTMVDFSMFLKKHGINNFTVTERLFLSVSANFTHIKTVKWFSGPFPQTSCNGHHVVQQSSGICTVEVLFATDFLSAFTKLHKVTFKLCHACLSTRLYGKTQFPMDGFPLNLTLVICKNLTKKFMCH